MSLNKLVLGIQAVFLTFSLIVLFPSSAQAACTIQTFWVDTSVPPKELTSVPYDVKVGEKYQARAKFIGCKDAGQGRILVTKDQTIASDMSYRAIDTEPFSIDLDAKLVAEGSYSFKVIFKPNTGALIEKAGPSAVKVVANTTPTGPPPPDVSQGSGEVIEPPINVGSIGELIIRITNYLLIFVGALSVLMIIIGGVRMVLSAGRTDEVTKGKSTITWAVIGLIVSLLAFSIVSAVGRILNRN